MFYTQWRQIDWKENVCVCVWDWLTDRERVRSRFIPSVISALCIIYSELQKQFQFKWFNEKSHVSFYSQPWRGANTSLVNNWLGLTLKRTVHDINPAHRLKKYQLISNCLQMMCLRSSRALQLPSSMQPQRWQKSANMHSRSHAPPTETCYSTLFPSSHTFS